MMLAMRRWNVRNAKKWTVGVEPQRRMLRGGGGVTLAWMGGGIAKKNIDSVSKLLIQYC